MEKNIIYQPIISNTGLRGKSDIILKNCTKYLKNTCIILANTFRRFSVFPQVDYIKVKCFNVIHLNLIRCISSSNFHTTRSLAWSYIWKKSFFTDPLNFSISEKSYFLKKSTRSLTSSLKLVHPTEIWSLAVRANFIAFPSLLIVNSQSDNLVKIAVCWRLLICYKGNVLVNFYFSLYWHILF